MKMRVDLESTFMFQSYNSSIQTRIGNIRRENDSKFQSYNSSIQTGQRKLKGILLFQFQSYNSSIQTCSKCEEEYPR